MSAVDNATCSEHPCAASGASSAQIVINVLVALSVSTLLTGIFLFGIGALKLGQWLRFIPYPVVGGFLAGSGILLITGGMEVNPQCEPGRYEYMTWDSLGGKVPCHWSDGTLHNDN